MVGRKGLEPSQIALSVPKTDASTNSAIAPQKTRILYIIEIICPTTNIVISEKFSIIRINMIISPCISICKTDPLTGFCYGCGRTNLEKKIWKDETTNDEWKMENINTIRKRLKGWQLESFEESYKYKIKNGISLSKKNQLK